MATSHGKPNLLVLISDQHRSTTLGCAGDAVATPALDRLAAGGVRMENCYCNAPLCVPSRMSLLTGQYCHRIGIWGNHDDLSANAPTFAHGLGMAGYRTVLVGRMHMVGGDQHHGFHERRLGDVSSAYIATNRAEHRFRGYYGERESLDTAGPGTAFDLVYDSAVAAEACRVIRDHEVSGDERPLCLVVGFYSPHDPYRVYQQYYDHYAPGDDPHDPEGRSLCPMLARRRQQARYADVTAENVRRARAAYRGKVEFLDGLIGQILDNLSDSPLGENAVRVYTSDHGEMMGDHGLWAKQTFYDPAARVPMIVAGSGIAAAGATLGEPVSLVDLAPTLLDLGGAEPLPAGVGQSLRAALAGGSEPPRKDVLIEIANGRTACRAVRRGRWKLNAYDGQPGELFDMSQDPREDRNLLDEPSLSAVRDELAAALTADGWSPDAVKATIASRKDSLAYIAKWAKADPPPHPIQWGLPAQL